MHIPTHDSRSNRLLQLAGIKKICSIDELGMPFHIAYMFWIWTYAPAAEARAVPSSRNRQTLTNDPLTEGRMLLQDLMPPSMRTNLS